MFVGINVTELLALKLWRSAKMEYCWSRFEYGISLGHMSVKSSWSKISDLCFARFGKFGCGKYVLPVIDMFTNQNQAGALAKQFWTFVYSAAAAQYRSGF